MLSPQRSSTWSPLHRLRQRPAEPPGVLFAVLYEMAGKPEARSQRRLYRRVQQRRGGVGAPRPGVVRGNGSRQISPHPDSHPGAGFVTVMLYNYAKFLGLNTPSSGPSATALLDCGEIAVWARPAVEFCIRTGALSAAGLRGDLYLPRGTLTRGEANRCLAAFADYIRSQLNPITAAPADKSAGAASACQKSLFDRLLDILKLRKSFKMSFDPTRKGTLTVPFHTIPPSESFSRRGYEQPEQPRRANPPGLLSILSYCDVSASIERSRAAIRSFNASMSGASTGALLRP